MTDTPAEKQPFDIYSVEPEELLRLVKKAGGQRAFSRKMGVKRTTLQNRLYALRKDPFTHRPAPVAREVAVEGSGRRRFILTSAQDASRIHEAFLFNLEAYRDYLADDAPCEIMIAGFTYSKRLFEEHSKHKSVFHKRVVPYLTNERIRIADRVDFCGEMNTLPTAENPLQGFHTYTRERWGIFPHAKVQLVSVPTMKHAPAKQIMTTGCVTKPNYVPKKAGIKASFHHVYGAVLVEVDDDGTFFCRHLIGDDDDGSFYDLDIRVAEGKVTTGHALECLTPGDVHIAQVDPVVCLETFGIAPMSVKHQDGSRLWQSESDSMIDILRPEHLFIHDVSDFRARNHHEVKDPHTRFKHHVNGVESVHDELKEVAMFLTLLARRYPQTKTVVVESNHDQALTKWLKTADYREDPVNAEFFLDCQRRYYRSIRLGEQGFSIFETVMQDAFEEWKCEGVRFLREDEPDGYVVGGVEHSCHGHRGPNGSRGSVAGMVKIAPRITMGHIHSPAIQDGVYVSGTTSLLDLGYNAGPSSWAQSHVAQYRSGKRAIITFCNGRWRI